MTLMHVLQVPTSNTSEPSPPQLGTALTQQPFTPVKVLVLMLVLLMPASILYFYTWCAPIALPVVPCTLLVA